jgi:pyrroline-5-carboxylate reductase
MGKLGIIGCGNLGLALLKGIRAHYPEMPIVASKRQLGDLNERYGNEVTGFTTDSKEIFEQCELIFIALKPFNVLEFLATHRAHFDSKRHTLVSVVTGITTDELKLALEIDQASIYRAMPNTAADVQQSMTVLSITGTDPLDRKHDVEKLFQAIGQVVWIDEKLMESATILGACGIAYVLRFIRAMIQGGIEVGFDAKTANLIVNQTVKGAAELLIKNGTHPEAEIDKVTTPKGVTIVGLNEMEHSGFSSALIKGIVTSYQKIEK